MDENKNGEARGASQQDVDDLIFVGEPHNVSER